MIWKIGNSGGPVLLQGVDNNDDDTSLAVHVINSGFAGLDPTRFGNWTVTNQIVTPPNWVDPANGDYHWIFPSPNNIDGGTSHQFDFGSNAPLGTAMPLSLTEPAPADSSAHVRVSAGNLSTLDATDMLGGSLTIRSLGDASTPLVFHVMMQFMDGRSVDQDFQATIENACVTPSH